MIEEQVLSNLAPLVAPLAPLPPGEVFSDNQWSTLLAICEVFFPSITPGPTEWPAYNSAMAEIQNILPPGVSPDTIKDYLAESFDKQDFRTALHRRMKQHVPASLVTSVSTFLSALSTKTGAFALTGTTTYFRDLPIDKRSEIVCNWSVSYVGPLRLVYKAMEVISKLTWMGQTKFLHHITGFPVVPEHEERNQGFQFDFQTFENTPADKAIEIAYDIVIVGSGCGAGVVASHLARAAANMASKPKVVVLEKGYHFPSTHFPMTHAASGENLMESGGGIQSDDGSIAVMAGSTWGGGGTINWSASLQPQWFVRDEWAKKDGLDFVATQEFQDCLDYVCDKMGVCKITDEQGKMLIPHNFGNSKLIEGARRLGLSVETVPQNSASKAHKCGYCAEGCAGATKQGPANLWLPDAAENGVEFIEGCWTEKILFEKDRAAKKVVGVKASWTSRDRSTKRQLLIKAKRVIVSGGTLNSPLLLVRSGIKNRNIGSNLHLHPVMGVGTIWPERARPWDGPILTAAVTSHENMDGAGHGPKIEMLAGTPGWQLPWQPFHANLTRESFKSGTIRKNSNTALASALDYKKQIAKYAHSAGYIVMQRDADTGKVFMDPADTTQRQVRIDYHPSQRDFQGILHGLIAACRIAYAAGASEIHPYSADIPPFVKSATADVSTNNGAFDIWLKEIKSIGVDTENCRLGSAHQMGTCRMSSRKSEGVVDSQGKVWTTKGLYVADASVFPSASGVNPMVTVMGLAEWIARGIVKEMKAEML